MATFQKSSRFLMFVLRLIGINPKRKSPKHFIKNVTGIILLKMCFSLSALCLFFLYKNKESIDKAILNLFFSVNILTCFCKSLGLTTQRSSFEELLKYFDSALVFKQFKDDSINKLIEDRNRNAGNWTKIIFASNFTILFLTVTFPIVSYYLTNKGSLPMGNSYQLTQFYVVEYIYQTFGYVCSATASSAFGSLYISCCIFITTQLEILIYEISSVECDRNSTKKHIRSQLVNVLEKQSLIIRANTLLNDVFSLILFLQMFVSTVGLCFALIHVENVSTMVVVPCQLLEIVMFCWFGQKMHDKSCDLADAFYAIPWIEMDPAERKWVLIGLRQAQRPLYSKAGPLRNMSHEALKNVLQTAYSLYAVLKEID